MQAWQLSSLSGKLSSVNTPSGANLQKSAGDDSYNKMMAEMHPDQVKPSSGAQQIGGC
jgi:hypothetical protein